MSIAVGASLNVVAFLLLAAVILTAAWRENTVARQLSRDRVEAELSDLRDGYGRLATDYGWWDEARDRIEDERNAEWADANIGEWLGRIANVTGTYVYDGDNRSIYSSVRDRATPGGFEALLEAARAAPVDRPEPRTGFITLDGRPVLAAASVLRPLDLVPGRRYDAVLVLVWDMDGVVLPRLRATTRMTGLRQVGSGHDETADGAVDQMDVDDIRGRPLVRLVWQPEQPGSRFAAIVLPSAGLALVLLSAIGWAYWFRGRQHLIALVAAEESRLRLLAAISHDLRQPLQSMALFGATLESEVATPQGRRALDFLRRGIERMDDLLAAILRLARLDIQHSGSLDLVPVSVGEVLRELVDELEPQARAKGLSLRMAPTSVVTRSDPVMLAALVRNLISNAIRYTQAGGVLVGVRRRGAGAEIWVCDTGIGIPAEQQKLIFEEFFQVGNAARDAAQGVGLGLAIVQRLARLLQCRIRLRSQPGRGSVFAVVMAQSPGLARRRPASAPRRRQSPVWRGSVDQAWAASSSLMRKRQAQK